MGVRKLHQTQLHQPAQVRVGLVLAYHFFGLGAKVRREDAQAGQHALRLRRQRPVTEVQRRFHIEAAGGIDADALQAFTLVA